MSISLLISVLILALVATPHCASMCGCGFARRPLSQPKNAQMGFQAGRILAYMALGAVAGGAHTALASLAIEASPILAALHYMLLALLGFMGLVMLLMPGKALISAPWAPIKFHANVKPLGPSGGFRFGLRWLAMPCGVIYAGVGLAYLTGSPWYGLVVMLVLGVATTIPLQISEAATVWVKSRWGEVALSRMQGAALLLGLAVLLGRQAGWLPTPSVLQGMGFCL